MPTSRYMDPKVDLVFKLVFGEHEHLMRSFLNALLPLPEDAPIERLEYLSPEQAPQLPGAQKNSILDVKCFDTQGRVFIVEMQMYWSASFEKRMVFSAAQAYVKQLPSSKDYSALQPVYALALSNMVFRKDSPQYYHHYRIVHAQDSQAVLKGLEFVFIELPKFTPTNRAEKLMAVKWLRFLKEVGNDDQLLDDQLLNDPLISEALGFMETARLTPAQLDLYHGDLDRARVEGMYARDSEARGEARGEVRAKAQTLRKQIARRYKVNLSAQQEARIAAASAEQLDIWLEMIFDVDTVQELLDRA